MIIQKVIVRKEFAPDPPEPEENSKNLMTPDFYRYVSKNGYHFTIPLADYYSKELLNNSEDHVWNCEQIKSEIGSALIDTVNPISLGDITYYSNFIYKKLFPHTILRDKDCAKTAFRILRDYEYPEASFNHFISDMIGLGKTVDWGSYL